MARIPEAELQHIKAAVPLVAMVKQQGRQMYKRGTKRRTGACGLSAARTRRTRAVGGTMRHRSRTGNDSERRRWYGGRASECASGKFG